MTEAQEQERLISWCSYQSCIYKELELIYHIPNGGRRNKREAAALKRQGVKSGVPDLHLPVARSGYNSLYIEMKVGKNKCSDNQNKWIDMLLKEGHQVKVCYGAEEAIEEIMKYLSNDY